VGSSLVLLSHPLQLPDSIYWIAIFGYTLAVLVGFYAVYHVIFLKFHGGR
jgi:ubiquinone biosynthesis protein